MSGDRFARCAAERGRRDRVVDRDGDRVLDELARLIRQRPAQRPAPVPVPLHKLARGTAWQERGREPGHISAAPGAGRRCGPDRPVVIDQRTGISSMMGWRRWLVQDPPSVAWGIGSCDGRFLGVDSASAPGLGR